MSDLLPTTLTKTGRPKMGTTLLLEAEGLADDGETVEAKGWLPVTVVGHLEGRRGQMQGLVGIIVEWPDGGRQPVAWPCEYRRYPEKPAEPWRPFA